MFVNLARARVKTRRNIERIIVLIRPTMPQPSDIVASISVICIGAFGISDAMTHDFGVLRNIGPGAFPLIVSLMIIIAGLLILIEAGLGSSPVGVQEGNSPRVLIFIITGLLAFSLLSQRFGILPGIFACVTLTSLAENKLKPWQVALLSLFLTAFCALVFIYFLKLPLRLVKW